MSNRRAGFAVLVAMTTALLAVVIYLYGSIPAPDAAQIDAPQAAGAPTLELVGQVGGSSWAVAAEGDYAYLGVGPRVVVFDITAPGTPRIVAKSEVFKDVVHDVVVANGYAYVAAGYAGLAVIDVHDPTRPRTASVAHRDEFVGAVAVERDRVYAGVWGDDSVGSGGSLSILDAADPAQLSPLGRLAIAIGPWRMVAADSHVYVVGVAHLAGQAYVFDVSNPAMPRFVSILGDSTSLERYVIDLQIVDQFAFVVAGGGGMAVVNVANPATPHWIETPDLGFAAIAIAVKDNRAYLAGDADGLHTIDISDPVHPRHVGDSDPFYGADVAVAGDRIVVAENNDIRMSARTWYDLKGGVRVFSNTSTNTAEQISSYRSPYQYAFDVGIRNGYLYLVDGSAPLQSGEGGILHIMDAGDPSILREIGTFSPPAGFWNYTAVAATDDYAYLLGSDVMVLDVHDPSQPRQVGQAERFVDLTPGRGVVRQDYLYVTSMVDADVQIFDVHRPAAPSVVSRFSAPDIPVDKNVLSSNLAVDRDHVFLTGGVETLTFGMDPGEGIEIVDVHEPTRPAHVTFVDVAEGTYGVAVADHYAFVAAGAGGLRVFDVADPVHPQAVGQVTTTINAHAVTTMDRYVFVADSVGAVAMIDVSDPTRPHEVAALPGPYYARDQEGKVRGAEKLSLVAQDGYVYVAHSRAGLYVLRVNDGTVRPTQTPRPTATRSAATLDRWIALPRVAR